MDFVAVAVRVTLVTHNAKYWIFVANICNAMMRYKWCLHRIIEKGYLLLPTATYIWYWLTLTFRHLLIVESLINTVTSHTYKLLYIYHIVNYLAYTYLISLMLISSLITEHEIFLTTINTYLSVATRLTNNRDWHFP